MSSPEKLPPAVSGNFGDYGPVVFNGKECVAWGFRPVGHLGDASWKEAGKSGTWYCLGYAEGALLSGSHAEWVLITRWLTPEEAQKKYGRVTDVERGPSGGFKSATYGSKRFTSKWLEPNRKIEAKALASHSPEKYEWVVRVSVRPKQDRPQSPFFMESVATLRALSKWYAELADVRERMSADGWSAFGSDSYRRTERDEDGYTRERLKEALEGLEVYVGQMRKVRQRVGASDTR